MAWKLKKNIPIWPESIDDLINGDPAEVTNLRLSGKGLECLPVDIDRLVNLQLLQLTDNGLSFLPDSFASLIHLEELDLDINRFNVFPKAVLTLPSLRQLDLSRNQLQSIPSSIGQLQQLKILWLYNNPLSDLPADLGTLPLSSLGISTWTANVADILSRLNGLRTLWLQGIGPDALAQALAHAPGITDLYLNNNQLAELPAEILPLHLQTLDCWGQEFKKFPELRGRPALRNITFISCGINMLPDWIGTLSGLQLLELSENALATLPPSLADLSDDLALGLADNPLAPPLGELAKQGTKPLFEYLRGLPRDEPEPEPEKVARELPEQRPAPLAARVVEGHLELFREPVSAEAARQEFAIMHGEVRQCAMDAREAIGGNHALLIGLIEQYAAMLGEAVTDTQGIRLGFAGQRLNIHSEAYKEEDGSDRLYQHQRAALNVLLAAHELLMRSVPEWRDYVLKAGETPPIAPAVVEQARTIAMEFAKALRDQPALVDKAVPLTLDEVADMAGVAPASSQQVAHRGLIDALANLFSPLAREALLVRKEVPSEARKMAAKGIIFGALTLGGWAASFITGHSVDLVALAQSLPNDFGWLKHVIAALRAMAAKDS